MQIAVACDHAGFPLKALVLHTVEQQGHTVIDLGAYTNESVDYPDYALKLGQAIQDGRAQRGILLCGSGVGASIAANKMPGIYAGVCHDTYSAHQGVEHDDMNVICLGARIIGPELVRELVIAFLSANFCAEERHVRRIGKVRLMEQRNMLPPLQALSAIGQSPWYDNIERRLLQNGELAAMLKRGDIRGVTSNPSIFHNAIARSNDYDAVLVELAKDGLSAEQIYERLVIQDICDAADLFLPLYQQTQGGDGYVSLEVNPLLAYDTEQTVHEALRLWQSVAHPNLMIKVPATKEGLPAIRRLIAAGLNVNVTLIFAIKRYLEVIDAYLMGLEDRLTTGQPVKSIASVASFFVSRLDSKADAYLDGIAGQDVTKATQSASLKGKLAIANARLAYQQFQEAFSSQRYLHLQAQGARLQRPLWASTSTKNPLYTDTMYVDALVGPNTVNTMPPQTLAAFKDHGIAAVTVDQDLAAARKVFSDLEAVGISIATLTLELEVEGVKAFADAFQALIRAIEQRRLEALQSK